MVDLLFGLALCAVLCTSPLSAADGDTTAVMAPGEAESLALASTTVPISGDLAPIEAIPLEAASASVTASSASTSARVPARNLEELFREGPPAFSKADAQRYLREVMPLVESAAGRWFKNRPKLRLSNRGDVAGSLARELLPQLRNLMARTGDDDLRSLAAKQAMGIAPVLLGKYGYNDRILYLLPRNVQPLLRLAKIDETLLPGLVKLVIAHELTHVLQDESVGLAKMLAGMKTQEELLAFNATIEGQAVFVQEAVGAKLGLDEEVIQFSRFFTAGAVKFDDPAFELLNRAMAAQFEQIYLGGRKFIAWHHQQGGLERVWQVVAAPPVKTAMIKHPETWSPVHAVELDYAGVLAGLERWFGDEEWLVDNIEVGQMGLQSAYAALTDAQRERVLAEIEHAQALVARVTDRPLMGNVTFIVLRDPSVAHDYIDAVEAMASRNFAQLNNSEKLRVTDIHASDVGEVTASIARRLEFTLIPTGEKKMRNVIYRIARGTVLIEITTCNVDLPPASVDALSTLVWRRYERLRQTGHRQARETCAE